MATSVSNRTIEDIKNRVNISDVVGQVVALKQSGENFKGLCPFHNEKTGSFVVNDNKRIFTCFGCHKSGDVIEFVKEYYKLTFVEAIEKIASEYNIPIETSASNVSYDKYYHANSLAAKFFFDSLTKKGMNKGLAYFSKREMKPETIVKFGLGYADESWDSLYNFLKSNNVEENTMLELGLIAKSKNGNYYDKFRNRVMFPIINTSRKVIGFGGRAIDPEDMPKYLNSAESAVFKKKYNLYGLNMSKEHIGKADGLIIVEGYMDAIALYQSGIKNVAATLGTALTTDQARLIRRYTKNVVLSYDSDSAGRQAALRGMEVLQNEDLKVKVLHVSDGKDPDEFVKKNGKEGFLKLVEGALPFCDYKIENAKLDFDLNDEEGKLGYLKKVTGILKNFSPVEQEIYAKKVAEELKISESALKLELQGESLIDVDSVKHNQRRENKTNTKEEVSNIERDLIRLVTRDQTYIERILEFPVMVENEPAQIIMGALMDSAFSENGLDLEDVRNNLDNHLCSIFDEIMENIPVSGSEEEIFTECVSTYKIRKLEKEEKKIITQFSLLDSDTESSHDEEVAELMVRLKDIQERIQIEKENRGQ